MFEPTLLFVLVLYAESRDEQFHNFVLIGGVDFGLENSFGEVLVVFDVEASGPS